MRVALPPVAGHAGPVIDQRQLLADETVEQGRFTDIGSADDRDDRQRHRGAIGLKPLQDNAVAESGPSPRP